MRQSGAGKGSRARPFSVSHEEWTNRWDAIFATDIKEDNMNQQVQPKKGTCGCGRSPTGDCVGWHALSEDAYKQKLAEHLEKTLDKKS